MKMNLVNGTIAAGVIAAAIVGLAHAPAYAQGEPARNIDPHRHPNLARAQTLSRQAFDALTKAQAANEFDLGGHAAHAKELLDQASAEMKAAAVAANRK